MRVKLEPDDGLANFQNFARGAELESGEFANDGTELDGILSSLNEVVSTAVRANGALSGKAAVWRQRVKSIKQNASRTPTFLVAVLGASGAGKSWLINALLGDHIVPTSGMEACTSMPIEVSYHPHELVNSQIVFISRESWLEEIKHFISALQDVRGVTDRLVEDGQEAWARIRVVYPRLKAEDLLIYSAEDILNSDQYIAGKLGETISFTSLPVDFKDELKRFTRTHREDVELWPLIARVVVQCNAPVLKEGLTLVDLPGILDSNRARASIYEEYLKSCDHAFIVAPIKRAATDHIAQELLGRAFKAQFLMDQKYTAECVTFIATSNDDISCKEIISKLELEWDDEWTCMAIEDRAIMERIKELERDIGALYDEKTVLETQAVSRRVKASKRTSAMSKKQAIMRLDLSISNKEAERDQLECSKSNLERKRKVFCARKRGEWSRKEIQNDFRSGLDDLCAELPEDGDTEDVGDINVFAVSAHDYLKLIGKSLDDGKPTFQSVEDTALPAVSQYCQELTLQRTQKAREKYAARLSDVVEDIGLQFPRRSAVHSATEQKTLKALWTNHENGNGVGRTRSVTKCISLEIRRTCRKTRERMMRDLNGILIPRMQEAAEDAGEEVADRIHTLGCRILYWQTVKAIFRRNGVWKQNDWNSAAVELFQRRIAASWARILSARRLEADAAAIEQILNREMAPMRDGAPGNNRVAQCIDRAIQLAQAHIQDAIQECQRSIQQNQQDISRTMARGIATQLQPLYHGAMVMTGRGVKARAMDFMREGLEECSARLFTSTMGKTSRALRSSLEASLEEHSTKMMEIPGMVESQVSLLWEREEAETAFHEQQASTIRLELRTISRQIAMYKET